MSNAALSYTVQEIAAMLKVTPGTVYKLVKSGELPSVRITARAIRITHEAYEAFMNRK